MLQGKTGVAPSTMNKHYIVHIQASYMIFTLSTLSSPVFGTEVMQVSSKCCFTDEKRIKSMANDAAKPYLSGTFHMLY